MKLEFRKTGNFWFDNAIVSLNAYLEEKKEEEPNILDVIDLTSDALTISDVDEKKLYTILEKAHREIGNRYLTKTKNYGWYYNDGNFIPYQRQDFKLHLKNFFTGKTGKPVNGTLKLPSEKPGKADRVMTTKELALYNSTKEAEKDKKPSGKVYQDAPPAYEFGGSYHSSFEDSGKHICHFSGESVKKSEVISGMHYPFLTGKSGEINFSSNLSASPKISSKMAFLSLFAFNNLYFSIAAQLTHYFLIHDPSLKKLNRFHKDIGTTKTLESENKTVWCNFDNSINGLQYEKESLLAFIFSLYEQSRDRLRSDFRKEILTTKIYTFSSSGGMFREVHEYSSIEKLFKLFDKMDLAHWEIILQQFQERLDSGKYNTLWRDKLSSAILSFSPVTEIVEQFVSKVRLEAGSGIPYLNEFISTYSTEILPYMDESKINLCKKIGLSIGSYVADSNNKSVLYSIRNSRTLQSLLNTLNEAQYKMLDHYKEKRKVGAAEPAETNTDGSQKFNPSGLFIPEEFLVHLPETKEWQEYKSLISIFAMNHYLLSTKPKKSKTA